MGDTEQHIARLYEHNTSGVAKESNEWRSNEKTINRIKIQAVKKKIILMKEKT